MEEIEAEAWHRRSQAAKEIKNSRDVARKIVTDFSLEQLFPDKDPAKDLYEQLLRDFPKEESNLFIVYECPNCLDQDFLDELKSLISAS